MIMYNNLIFFPIERTERFIMNQEKIIKDHVLKETKESFSKKVEDLVWQKDLTYLDAIHELMEQSNIEPEAISKLLSKDLVSKVEREAEDLSLLKTKTNRIM